MNNIFFSFIQSLPPELSHYFTIKFLKLNFIKRAKSDDPCLNQHIFGLDFSNPIGIAAGFDKDVEVVESLLNLGFGFVEAGTVTPKPQLGNKRPRVFRLLEDDAIINHLGFNNKGSDYAKRKLARLNLNSLSRGIVGINIGKNKDTKNLIKDYVYCLRELGPLSHYVTINISSPNTPGLRDLQNRSQIEKLIKEINKIKDESSSLETKPIIIKISPDLNDDQLRDMALICLANGIDGITISNTTIERPSSLLSKNKKKIGGLSGRPIFYKSNLVLKKMYNLTNGQIPLIGVGGISNGADFYEKIKSGASLAQLYTSLTYNGPSLIEKIKLEIMSRLRIDGYSNIKHVIGKDV